MTYRSVLGAACVLMLVAFTGGVARAQSGVSDPVTGNWGTGGLVFLELHYDGHSTVTGTTVWRQGGGVEQRAAIEHGTFDGRSGKLRLTGETERNGKHVQYEIQGTIKDGILAGTSNVGGQKNSIRFGRQ